MPNNTPKLQNLAAVVVACLLSSCSTDSTPKSATPPKVILETSHKTLVPSGGATISDGTGTAITVPRQVYVMPPSSNLSRHTPGIVTSLVKQGFEPIPDQRYGALTVTIVIENTDSATRVIVNLSNGISPLLTAEGRNTGSGNAAANSVPIDDIAGAAVVKFAELLAAWRPGVTLQDIPAKK